MYKKILIPTDGSDLSMAAAAAGIKLAKSLGAAVIAIYVAPPFEVPVYVDGMADIYLTPVQHRTSARAYGQHFLDLIGKVAAKMSVACTDKIVFAVSPAAAIIQLAKRGHCDLIFMGSHGRSRIGTLFLGSVTTRVLAGCHIPVMVHRASRAELQQAQALTKPKAGGARTRASSSK
jgi:nucleotide-binding universal stress UspA family protein